jgi:hypothetical protein
MASDGLWHALRAPQPSGEQSKGVAPIDRSARWAQRLASGTAGLQEHPVGLGRRPEQGAPGPIVLEPSHRSDQTDRTSTEASGLNLALERLVAAGCAKAREGIW